jgi:glucose/arabinose dehydrogenase
LTHGSDGTNRLFITERGGRIKIFDGNDTLATPFFDITLGNNPPPFTSGGERGLLGLAFHPNFRNNGYFYINYTESTSPPPDCPPGADCDWNTVIARYQVSNGDPNVANPNSEIRLLVINQDYANHNGGNILFGPDGYLYIGMGDGGSGGDPQDRAQSMDTLLGKVLRIDVDGGGFAPDCGVLQNYGVPADNPFRDGAGGYCDAIWALGLRNPWRWSFDRLTGDMFIGDVGQHTWEEVDFEPTDSLGGLNWGWRCYEGNHEYNTTGCGPTGQYDFPIVEYDQRLPGRQAVTGGFVYRGPTMSGFRGTYVHADYASGEIWFTVPDGPGVWNTTLWQDTSRLISSFGEDERGELYLVDLGGTIYRFESPSAPTIFGDSFESGDTTGWSAVVP